MSNEGRVVQSGETVLMVMPCTEMCGRMRVAGQLRRVQVFEAGAAVLRTDGQPQTRYLLALADVGISVSEQGMSVPEPPEVLYQVTRGGKPVQDPAPSQFPAYPVGGLFGDMGAACSWLLKVQPQSVDWAMRYEGYGVREVRPGDRGWPEVWSSGDVATK